MSQPNKRIAEEDASAWRRLCIAALVLVSMMVPVETMRAQVSTGDILGVVQDPTGAAVARASVTLQSLDTNQLRTVVSDAGGNYEFSQLPPGQYSLSVTAAGFRKYVLERLTLEAGDRARIDAHVTVGTVGETVEVTTAEPALQTDTSALGTVVTNEAVQDLPLNGRNFVQLAQLAPGANEGPQNSIGSGQRPDDRRQTSAISANGQPDLANEQLLDGVDNNDALIGVLGARPSVEAISEFRVVTSLYPADMGHTGGAVVSLITKSGTKDFHGSIYEFFRNDLLDTWDPFIRDGNLANPLVKKPEYRQNQFGASMGGPLLRQTFFFGDYEGLRIVQGQPTVSTVPTLAEEQNPGNFSDIGGPVIPSTALDPVGLNYFKLYPAPTLPATANNFIYSPNKTQYSNGFDVRGDHTLTSGDHAFARETYNNVATLTPSALPPATVAGLTVDPGGNFAGFFGPATNIAHNAAAGYTHLFTQNLIADFRVGYARVYNDSSIPNQGKNVSQAIGLQGVNVNSELTGLTPLLINGYAGLGDSIYLPIVDTSNTLEYNGNVSYIRGPHTLKLGAAYIRRGGRTKQNPFGIGFDVFVAPPTGNALANLLIGAPLQVQRSNQAAVPNYRRSQISEFAQDDWRVTKSLTVNLGVRYDIFTPVTETANHLSLFDPTTLTILQAGVNGVSRSANVRTNYGDVAPRLGFEFSAASKTVIRGGFGISFLPLSQITLVGGNPPYVATYAPNVFTVPLDTPYPAIVPASTATSQLSGSLAAIDLNLKDQYIEQFALNVQQQVGATVLSVGYVGELGRRLTTDFNINAIPLTASPNYVELEPFHAQLPNVTGGITDAKANGASNYNALQLSAERRTSRGLTLNGNYTYARNLGNVTAYSDNQLNQGTGIVPSLFSTLDYGNSDLDIRHRFTAQINYLLPFAKGSSGFVGFLAKGWQANAIDVWQTGTAFSLTDSVGQANPSSPTDRPNQIGNPNSGACSNGEHVGSRDCWFNPDAFAQQELGTIGVLPGTNAPGTIGPFAERRNQLYGPHFRHFDLSLFKNWQFEKYSLQFRAESFNLSNTPNYAQPVNTVASWNPDGTPSLAGGLSSLTSLRFGTYPRQIQLALKLTF